MKKAMLQRHAPIVPVKKTKREAKLMVEEPPESEFDYALEEAMMEVAADQDQPFPAPHLSKRIRKTTVEPLKRKQK